MASVAQMQGTSGTGTGDHEEIVFVYQVVVGGGRVRDYACALLGESDDISRHSCPTVGFPMLL